MDKDHYEIPKGIIRFEQGNTRGWWVRVQREGVMFRKLFSDGVFGSPDTALEHAKAYLEEVKQAFPRSRKDYSQTKRRGNGPIPGVWKQITKSKGHEYWCWFATWSPEPGIYKTKRFAVGKWGDTGAMRKAIELRLTELEKMSDKFPEEYKEQIKELPKDLINTGLLQFAVPDKNGNTVDVLPYHHEGDKSYSIHLLIERSKKLRDEKIQRFIDKNGTVYCELCRNNMKQNYPWLERDYIEVHHIVPLAELTKPTCNSLDDLVLLCPNCHMAIHQGDAQDNFLEAMILFKRDLL